jgi:hypothetical protein
MQAVLGHRTENDEDWTVIVNNGRGQGWTDYSCAVITVKLKIVKTFLNKVPSFLRGCCTTPAQYFALFACQLSSI